MRFYHWNHGQNKIETVDVIHETKCFVTIVKNGFNIKCKKNSPGEIYNKDYATVYAFALDSHKWALKKARLNLTRCEAELEAFKKENSEGNF